MLDFGRVQLSVRNASASVGVQVTLGNFANRRHCLSVWATRLPPINLLVGYWLTKIVTGTGNQGSIPESRPEKRPPLLRHPAGAKICQCSDE